jgi:hypothetical protein
MPIDPSIALSANSGGGNLLQTLMGATQLQGAQQQLQSNTAVSQAYKQATDPLTGKLDQGKLASLIAQGPAAYNLPQIQAGLNANRAADQTYDIGQLKLASDRTNMLSNGFGGLLASGNATPQAVMQIATQGIKAGLFSPQEAVNFTSDMPSDPSQLQNWIKQKYVGFSGDSDRIKTLMPQTQTINTGAQQVVAAFDPLTGKATGQNTVFNNQLSPGDASTPTQVFDPASGTMRNVTRQQFANMANGQGGGQPQGQPAADGSLGTGRLTPITQAPGLQAAPALGAAEAATVIGKGSAENSLSLQSQASTAPQSIYQFQNMRTALSDINTGPGTDWRNTAQSFAQALSPDIAQKLGVDPQKIASREEFSKFATQATQATMGSLGEGTDAKLASAYAANPNATLSKLGNQQIIDVLIAGQQAIQAKNQAWQSSGLPPEQFNKFSTQWNKDVDPRVFAAQNMDATARYKMLDSLTPKEQESFKQSYLKAHSAGYIQ